MTTAIPFELYLIWQEGTVYHMDNLKDWQDHCLPGLFWVYVDVYPAPVSHWKAEELAERGTYELHAEKLPAGFVAGVLSLSTYEEVVGYLSAVAQGRVSSLPDWVDQDWNEIPLYGMDGEKQDWALDWVNTICPGIPEKFDINWLDATYIMKQFLRFHTNEWYEDPVTYRVFYR